MFSGRAAALKPPKGFQHQDFPFSADVRFPLGVLGGPGATRLALR